MIEAQNEMATALNPIKEFFDDCVDIIADCITPKKTVYQTYLKWCSTTGRNHPLGTKTFWPRFKNEMMTRSGMTTWDKSLEERTSSERKIRGVRVTNGGGPLGGTSDTS